MNGTLGTSKITSNTYILIIMRGRLREQAPLFLNYIWYFP